MQQDAICTTLKAMYRVLALQVFLLSSAVGQNCIPYGKRISLEGSLSLKDEAGYNQFIVLGPERPICTVTDPKDVADPSDDYSGVTEIQAGVYGSDAASDMQRDRLERLIGHRVTVRGDLFPATTGYHRTCVQLRVEAVDALDAAGQQALRTPRVKFQPKRVVAYDVTINASRRLLIVARDTASNTPLTPGEKYAPHWMTGGEVVYVDCLDGYERKLISTTEKDGGICFDGDLCGFNAFPEKSVTIAFRCVKKP